MTRITLTLGLEMLLATTLALALAPSIAEGAGVPKLVNVQGVLRDGSGNAVPDGVYTVRFRIYDDSTAGSTLWEETVPVPTTVGLFTVRLGDATALPENLFSTSANRFVGIRVNLDPEQAPRTRLISVPYALHGLRSDSATVALGLTCTSCVGTSDIDATQVQRRVTGAAVSGQYITAINQDGSVATAVDQSGVPSGWTDDGAVVRLSSGNDNVGIGTTSPVAKLHIDRAEGEGLPANLVNEGLTVSNNAVATDIATVNVIGGSAGFGRIAFGNNATAYDGYIRYRNSTDALEFGASGFQIMTILGTGEVGMGTTSPLARLHITRAGGQGLPGNLVNEGMVVNNNAAAADNATVHVIGGSTGFSRITFGDNSSALKGYIRYRNATNAMEFGNGGFQVMTLANPNLGVGELSPATRLHVSEFGADVATFNRRSTDGVIIRLNQDDVTEGTISVSGTTVSYNAFTGSHYGWTEESLERGELVTLTGENRFSHDHPNSEIIYGIRRSSGPNDPACLGAYLGLQAPSHSQSSENPHLVMAVGNGELWVADAGADISPGDYLISSDVPGHAMRDDEAHYPVGHIVARAAEAVHWSGACETTGGRKHERISVLFGNFVRSNPSAITAMLESLQKTVNEQQMEIQNLKRQAYQNRGSEELARR